VSPLLGKTAGIDFMAERVNRLGVKVSARWRQRSRCAERSGPGMGNSAYLSCQCPIAWTASQAGPMQKASL
jgi:hypothetical protein